MEHVAVLLLPEPLSAAVPQPVIVVPPSLKLTVPVGAAPTTVAVKVTTAPATAGVPELASDVIVGDGVDPAQFPDTLPVPSRRNVAVARQPALIAIACGVPPPSATGVIGCGDKKEALPEDAHRADLDPPVKLVAIDSAFSVYVPRAGTGGNTFPCVRKSAIL